MRKFRILILVAIILGLMTTIALSCHKGSTTPVKPTMTGVEATIIYTGDFAADGCDYLLQTDTTTFYHADNLPSAFQKNNLNVTVNYNLSDAVFQCGMNPNTHIPIIHITDIKNR